MLDILPALLIRRLEVMQSLLQVADILLQGRIFGREPRVDRIDRSEHEPASPPHQFTSSASPIQKQHVDGDTHIFPTPSYTFVSFGMEPSSPEVSCRSRTSRCLVEICVLTMLICCWAAIARDSISWTSW
jgi:hypothetical protein